MNKLLGIDYGDKRIGLALAEAGSLALPYKVIDNDSVLEEINKIIKEENITTVVVGLPHSLSGNDNERLNITKQFIKYLENNLTVSIKTVDEQMTSKLYTKQGVKKDIDKHAATAILDTYLAQNDS